MSNRESNGAEHTARVDHIPITEQCYKVGFVFSALMSILGAASYLLTPIVWPIAFGIFATVMAAFALLMYIIDPYHKEAIGYND